MPVAAETAYLIRVVSEPEEEPIKLTQNDFDLLIDVGRRTAPVEEGVSTVEFATVETVNGENFMYRGAVMNPDEGASLLGRALARIIREALDRMDEEAREREENDNPSTP